VKIKFTLHALEQMRARTIDEQEILDAINIPEIIVKRYGRHHFKRTINRGVLEVVCEKTENHINIITIFFEKWK